MFRSLVLVTLASSLYAGQIPADWIGPSGTGGNGGWNTPGFWSTGVVPNNGGGTTYAVSIAALNTSNITLDTSPTIDSLLISSGNSLSTNAGTTLTSGSITNSGSLFLQNGASFNISGNLTNSGAFATNQNNGGGLNTATIGGSLINSLGGSIEIGKFNTTSDLVSAASLTNNGNLTVGRGATLSLTTGLTSIAANSNFDLQGSFTVGGNSGLAALDTVNGGLFLRNAQTTNVTPGSGTLTIASSGVFDIESNSTLTINGDVSNTGTLQTNRFNTGGPNTVTISGTLTNNANGAVQIGSFNDTADVMNVATLVNNGNLTVGAGATLNLTTQTGGLTAINSGSAFDLQGNIVAGGLNGLRNLGTIDGQLFLSNAQTTSITPGGGTLSISSTGLLDVEGNSTLTLNGNLTNSGTFQTNRFNRGGGDSVTITGTLTNNSGGQVDIGHFNDTTDVVNTGSLVNNGALTIGGGATLNLTTQTGGLTGIAAGSAIDLQGSFTAGGLSALRNVTTIDGQLFVSNGQSTPITPSGGTLAISSTGLLDVEANSTLTLNGDVSNSGLIETNRFNRGGGDSVTITGTLTNNSGGQVDIGHFNNTTDVVNTGSLVNNGALTIGRGATLNLTTQTGGLTGIAAGSAIDLQGSFTAGGLSALRNVTTIDGQLFVSNAQTTPITPSGGTLSVSAAGILDVEGSSTLTVTGNLNNSGLFETNRFNRGGGNSVTITGALTNNVSGQVDIGHFNNTTDVVNAGSLSNNGNVTIGRGATLNLTTQTGGLTDIVAGSAIDLQGSFTAGGLSAIRNLASVEGTLLVSNGQSTAITPGGGTLAISSSGIFDVESASTVTINGGVDNSGLVETNRFNRGGPSHFDVTGQFTNNASGQVDLGHFNTTTDEATFGSLLNNGAITIGQGATLSLTSTSTNNSSIVLNGGTLAAAGELDNTGTVQTSVFETTGSTITAGDFVNLNGGVFNLNVAGDTAQVTTFTNGGTANAAAGTRIVVGTGAPTASTGLDMLADGTFEELLLNSGAFGVLNVTGPALLTGTLDITLLNGFTPSVGSIFTFLHFTPGSLSGTFANLQGQLFNNGTEAWQVVYDNAGGNVSLQAIANTTPPANTPEPATLILVGVVLVVGSRLRRYVR